MIRPKRFKPRINGHNDGKKDSHVDARSNRIYDNNARGEAHPCSVLTDEDVVEMRQRYKNGELTYASAGREYGVSNITAKDVITGWTWKHVPMPA